MLHIPRRGALGSTLKEGRSSVVQQFPLLVLQGKIGRSSGRWPYPLYQWLATNAAISVNSALSEVVGVPLPYDDVLSLRDRMWEISPTLVRYSTAEKVSPEVTLAGLAPLGTKTSDVTISGTPLKKPISNFYQTDPISRA